jgi:transcriptional regulator of aromatic amino acid metabolism
MSLPSEFHPQLAHRHCNKGLRVFAADLAFRLPVLLPVPARREVLNDASRLASVRIQRGSEVLGVVEAGQTAASADVVRQLPLE